MSNITTFESTHDINLHGSGESIAAASDNNPAENVKPFIFCKHTRGACVPSPFSVNLWGSLGIGPWFSTANSIIDAGEEVLTVKSFFLCTRGGMEKVKFLDAGQDSIRLGNKKTIQDLLEEKEKLMEQIEHIDPHSREALVEKLKDLDEELQPRIDKIPYNVLQHTSSHNSYDKDDHSISMKEQFDKYNTHSFELDIHIGDPDFKSMPFTDIPFINTPLINTPFIDIPSLLEKKLDNDFYVYHDTRDRETRYKSFSQASDEIGKLPNKYPVTVFVDLKDPLNANGEHSSSTFDKILEDQIGSENLYTPEDLINKAKAVDPSISNLADAVDKVGWPTLGELNGKVMVIGTDNIGSYNGNNAFVADKPHLDGNGQITDKDMIFFNIGKPNILPKIPVQKDYYDDKQIKMLKAIADRGMVARGYYFNGEEHFENGVEVGLNHITTNDIEEGGEGGWTDLSTAGFPFKILDSYLEEEVESLGGHLAIVTGATLFCEKGIGCYVESPPLEPNGTPSPVPNPGIPDCWTKVNELLPNGTPSTSVSSTPTPSRTPEPILPPSNNGD